MRALGITAVLFGMSGCDLFAAAQEESAARDCPERDIWYADGDGDGVGDAFSVYVGCAAPAGFVAEGGDCDDADAALTTGCGAGDSGDSGG